jgi:uncharacterized Zn finger protein
MMARWSYYPGYEPARPLPVERGIAARSRRGAIGETWWSQRFIALLESFGVGSRLTRGRNYARSGQVAELEVESGIVLAEVQGSRHTPYRVRIRTKVLSEHQWRRAEKAMAAQALPLAKLLAGEMPHEIEDLLAACKLTLFPSSYRELKASCTCPDAVNPCKHIAAVYYILAERFDQDPFLIFAWRGRTSQELLEHLQARRGGATQEHSPTPSRPDDHDANDAPPLSELVDCFWNAGPELVELRVSPLASAAPDALLRRLGPAPAESAGRNVADLLAPAYARLAAAAERRALE